MSLLLLFSKPPIREIFSYIASLGEQSTTQGIIPVGLGTEEIQNILLQYGTSAQNIESILNELSVGDSFQSVQALINKLSNEFVEIATLENSISEHIYAAYSIRNTITQDSVQKAQALLGIIAEADPAQDYQILSQYIGDLAASLKTITYSIYLDGRNVTRRLSDASITCDESSVHNSITMSSIDMELFNWSDPFILPGTSRIEVHVGNRILYFLLEKRSGGERSFNLWGRSTSAIQDYPYSDDVAYSLTSPKSAQDVVEDLVSCAVDWECDNWVLPETFEFRGTPLEGALKVASVIGAKVRSNDDGSLEIRNAFPVRPIDLNVASPDLLYGRGDILEGMSYSEEAGERFNEVEVFGSAKDETLPSLELVESSPKQGDVVHIRAYWDDINPNIISSENLTALVTSGIVYKGIETRKIVEKIYFRNGVATVSYPIYIFDNTRWIGVSLGNITSSIYSRETAASTGIENPTGGFGIAEVTYHTIYGVYELTGHDIEELMFILSHQIGSNVDVLVRSVGVYDTVAYPAPSISDPYLTSISIAALSGKNILDETKYDKKIFSIRASYDDLARDGNIVFLNDGEIGCSGNFSIKSASIVFNGPKVVNEMEVIQWQI